MEIKNSGNKSYLFLVSCVAALGGLLFGFDTAVISGAIGYFQPEFNLSEAMTGWVVSSTIAGCFAGSAIAGYGCDRYGRKPVLLVSALFFLVSSGFALTVKSASGLIFLRGLGGIGIGLASVVSPLYITEISPSAIRGRLTSLQQLAIVSGILVSFLSNNLFFGSSLDDHEKWRWMIAVGIFPSAFFFLLLFLVPESPRWLIKKNKPEKAGAILLKIHGKAATEDEIVAIRESLASKGEGSIRDLFRKGMRKALIAGAALAFFSQVTGINAIMYYAPEIFKNAGLVNSVAYSHSVWVGIVNLVFTIIAMLLVDKIGRKPLLLAGFSVMTLSLAFISYAFYWHLPGLTILIGILAFCASFAISVGVVGWIVFSEIFPNKIRGRAVSIVTGVVWITCFLVSQSFPILNKQIGASVLFAVYAGFCALGFVFVLSRIPETRQKTLEEIEKIWIS